MSPRTRRIRPAASVAGAIGALLVSAACGAPPGAGPAELPVPAASAPSLGPPAGAPVPSDVTIPPLGPPPTTTQGYPAPGITYPTPGYATPPPQPQLTTTTTGVTTPPLTNSPTPTPTHAAKCRTSPTGPQILALIKDDPGVPDKELAVADGPFCSGTWSFTTVKIAGQGAEQVEPLMVVATGKGTKLALVAAGTHVCNARVQAEAPPGIRVLACGF
ncbi:hypothetical protein AB0F81_00965 [Actinoplanes sp. NPDC024001]|uniref:hypothetical protein n=1 Tax=Actinoplanes sp. NPDC024001 TaxID=3154598 RepID=UPI0033E761C9